MSHAMEPTEAARIDSTRLRLFHERARRKIRSRRNARSADRAPPDGAICGERGGERERGREGEAGRERET